MKCQKKAHRVPSTRDFLRFLHVKKVKSDIQTKVEAKKNEPSTEEEQRRTGEPGTEHAGSRSASSVVVVNAGDERVCQKEEEEEEETIFAEATQNESTNVF